MQSLGEILISKNIISRDDFLRYEKEARGKNILLEDILIQNGVAEDIVFEAKSESLDIPLKSLKEYRIPFEILKYTPEETAELYHFIPLRFIDGVLEVGMVHPEDLEAREALRFLVSKSNLPFKIYLISNSDFVKVLKEYKGLGGEAKKVLGELEMTLAEGKKDYQKIPGLEDEAGKEKTKIGALAKIIEEAPIVKMVGIIIRHALEGNASDIHIEPLENKLRVRFRMDGVLYTSLLLPLAVHEAIVSRIKILTNMMLDEKRKPQDGRFSVRLNDKEIDFRVSTLPTQFGEKVAIRLLGGEKTIISLEGLGLNGRNLELVENILNRPYGLVLVTGPTGSGKSTTLYAMLQKLNTEGRNIISLEDPIEYKIEGINQSQVRPEIGYDFANGLRTILRQDPDIIMVGEIRDSKTANLAVHAALTGHLVLSTFHTNTAVGAISRLIDMGVDSYLLPSTLVLIISQRLTRTLCAESKNPVPLKSQLKEKIEKEVAKMPENIREKLKLPKEIYQSQPSALCPRGTKGRIGIFEVLEMTKNLENIILTNLNVSVITEEARRQGMITLREDGLIKVLEGKIGLEELNEVAGSL